MNKIITTVALILAISLTVSSAFARPWRWEANQKNTAGWQLMTPEERTAFQIKMREVKTYDDCKVLQTEHRSAMETRAKEKGVTLMAPRANACDRMQARGLIK